ncbi:hypothetical protein CJ030_MR5G010393 [Morella rubra]|uniref:Uncharacterized protein n=1 Tax=Morella rubra TaxID=262757 RepID=A0A6A1VP39_9ROSI|nr:hypothetical protein CJ030_MR5G010393 [Morella rubra]
MVFNQDSFSYGCSDIYLLGGGGPRSYCFGLEEDKGYFETLLDNNLPQGFNANLESSPSSPVLQGVNKELGTNMCSSQNCSNDGFLAQAGLSSVESPAATTGRRKRRRIRMRKNWRIRG